MNNRLNQIDKNIWTFRWICSGQHLWIMSQNEKLCDFMRTYTYMYIYICIFIDREWFLATKYALPTPCHYPLSLQTSRHGDAFLITDLVFGNSGQRWFPTHREGNSEFWYFLCCQLNNCLRANRSTSHLFTHSRIINEYLGTKATLSQHLIPLMGRATFR